MIYYHGGPTLDNYPITPFSEFMKWVTSRRSVEFDIETTVTSWWCDKKIMTMQFGDVDDQWVLQWPSLSIQQQIAVKLLLEDKNVEKVIHNAMFECTVCLFHGIRIRNVFDTMLAEQVRFGGEHVFVGYSLEELCLRRLGVQLDKQYQTAFGDGKLDLPRLIYAAQDVSYLSLLKKEIYQECQQFGLDWAVALENECVQVFSEMTYNGMKFDPEHWRGQLHKVQPLVNAAREKMNEWLRGIEFEEVAYRLGYISNEDRVLFNLNSLKQKKLIFDELFPELPGTTKAVLQKYRSDCMTKGISYPDWLNHYLEGDNSLLIKHLMTHHRQWLVDHELIIPRGTVTINWNSQKQVLPVMQVADPRVTDLSAETMGRVTHPIFADYEDYVDTNKLTTAFGEEWIVKNMEPDGFIRASINQVLTTGRISTKKPNMQQIPAKESVGNAYRHAFIPPAGQKFCSSDYVSQELILIADLSKDPVWLEALSKGQDLHSICAEMVFGAKWKAAADKDCAYYRVLPERGKAKEKCKCKAHKYMRNGVKTINFGLAYGMSKFKLASTLRISVPEADQLIYTYFKSFPNIGNLLNFLGEFGVTRGYIQTIPPIKRRRFFPYWKHHVRFIEGHLKGVQYHPTLGEIERASKNMPIQGTSADITKVALCLIYWTIYDDEPEKWAGKVYMRMQVHDQVDCTVDEQVAAEWKQRQNALMELGASFIIKSGILKAETNITDRWEK